MISIIGILSAFLAGGYVNSQKSSRDAARKINLKSIGDALNMYYNDNNEYPDNITFGGELKKDGIVYIKKIPSETSSGKLQIKYEKGSKSFKLYTNLENGDDKGCLPSCTGYTVTSGCCYMITSPNIGVDDGLI